MPKASPGLFAFNVGELSSRLDGRVDFEKYHFGCKQLENMLPLVQGGAMKRPGFRFVKEVKDSADATRLIPFEFSTTQAYILEFGDLYMRVYYSSGAALETAKNITGATQANPVVITSTSHGFSNGDQVYIQNVGGMTEINDKYFTVANVTANTFELSGEDGTGHTAYTSGGTASRVYTLTTPYAKADLEGIQYAQSADVLYLAHKSYAPRKLERTGHTSWTITAIAFDHEPFAPENTDEDEFVVCSASEGTSKTLTSPGGIFTSDMVGGYFKLREIVEVHYPEWVALTDKSSGNNAWNKAEHFMAGASIAEGDSCFYDGRVYKVVYQSATLNGPTPPTHDEGTESDGRWHWEYLHSGYGYVKITAFTDAYRVTVDVIKYVPASMVSADKTITGATQADPVAITSTNHGLQTGDQVWIQDVGGMTEINQRLFTVTRTGDNTFTLDDEDGTGHTAYTSGGIAVHVKSAGVTRAGANPHVLVNPHRWSHGAFSTERGYPRAVTFFEDRLWWFATDSDPQTCWGSKTSEYENHEETGEDDSAIVITLNTDQVNVIEWVSPSDLLILGTAGGEFTLGAVSTQDALTPGNVRALTRSTYGAKAETPPVRVDQVLLFVQRAGRKLREFVYDDASQAYNAPDLTILADHIALQRIKKIAFQQEPNRILWCILHNGSLIAFTYERAQEVVGWHRHPVGGTSASVESIAVIPHPDGDRDQLWAIISRTINGGTKRYVEYLEEEWLESNDLEDAFYVDSGLTYDGAATSTITGLDHLEGETLNVLADGETHRDLTVSSGQVLLDANASVVQAGLGYDGLLETMRLEAGAADGTAQGRTKRIHSVILRLWQTGKGLFYGPTETDADDEVPDLVAGSLFDGDTDVQPWPGGYEKEARLVLKHTEPLPFMVTGIFPQLKTAKR